LANHPSLIDAIILFAIIDNPNGIIKSTLFNNPSMYGLAKIAGLMRNVEGPELIRKSIESISAGENLIIFPEGTRTKVLGQVTFKKGAAYIAIKGKFNIIPVTLVVSEPFLRKNQSWYDVPLKKPVLTVSVLNEIDVATDVNTNDDLLIEASKLTKYFEKNFTHEFRMYEQS
jgi:1-acyl-sn-glycerol-3-phosphate acyltransferase